MLEKYVCHSDLDDTFICGRVKYPKGTDFYVDNDDYIITPDLGTKLCLKKSEHAYQAFTYNNDGKGIQRRELLNTFYNLAKYLNLQENEDKKDKVFDIFDNDGIAKNYRKGNDEDMWVWDRYKVSCGQIYDLEHMIRIMKNIIGDAR